MKFESILLKYKNYFLVIAIVLIALAVSIRSRDGKVSLVLQNYPIIIFLMIIISLLFIVLYIQINKKNIENLSHQIKDQSQVKSEDYSALLAAS